MYLTTEQRNAVEKAEAIIASFGNGDAAQVLGRHNPYNGPLLTVNYTSTWYDPDALTRSNHDALRELLCGDADNPTNIADVYESTDGVFAIDVDTLLTHADALSDSESEEYATFASFIEALDAMAGYPIVDEDLHSQYELEEQGEAWESWGQRDAAENVKKGFLSGVRAAYGPDVAEAAEEALEASVAAEEAAEEAFLSHYSACRDEKGLYAEGSGGDLRFPDLFDIRRGYDADSRTWTETVPPMARDDVDVMLHAIAQGMGQDEYTRPLVVRRIAPDSSVDPLPYVAGYASQTAEDGSAIPCHIIGRGATEAAALVAAIDYASGE